MDIFQNILKSYNLSVEDLNKIKPMFKPENLKRGDIFIRRGKGNQKIGILINGLMIATYLSEKGKEVVSMFYYPPKNIIVSNHEGFFYNTDSTETIKALQETQLFSIEKKDLLYLYEKYPQIGQGAREMAEAGYINALNRIHELQSLSGKERVKKLLKENKELLNLVSRQRIASYLGLNRNDFSKYLSGK